MKPFKSELCESVKEVSAYNESLTLEKEI